MSIKKHKIEKVLCNCALGKNVSESVFFECSAIGGAVMVVIPLICGIYSYIRLEWIKHQYEKLRDEIDNANKKIWEQTHKSTAENRFIQRGGIKKFFLINNKQKCLLKLADVDISEKFEKKVIIKKTSLRVERRLRQRTLENNCAFANSSALQHLKRSQNAKVNEKSIKLPNFKKL